MNAFGGHVGSLVWYLDKDGELLRIAHAVRRNGMNVVTGVAANNTGCFTSESSRAANAKRLARRA